MKHIMYAFDTAFDKTNNGDHPGKPPDVTKSGKRKYNRQKGTTARLSKSFKQLLLVYTVTI